MTIAACYLSSEGVVLGADSTSTMWVSGPSGVGGGIHHLNYAQKLFEVGEQSTIGLSMWGMGSIGSLSHRTLVARFADNLSAHPASSMGEVATRFSELFWTEYSTQFQVLINRFQVLDAKTNRTVDEENEWSILRENLSGGFCVGGHLPPDRIASAFEIAYGPWLTTHPQPNALTAGSASFWGCPNIIERVLFAWDTDLFAAIMASGMWSGTDQDLFNLIWSHRIAQPSDLPLREAIDWVNTVIYTTIKAMKFSHHLPVCGGPIEIAVISTDRRFRWVKHKQFDEALA